MTYRAREAVLLWAEGYDVCLAEIAGRNIIPLIKDGKDGKDEEVLREVGQICKYCGFVYVGCVEPAARDEVN